MGSTYPNMPFPPPAPPKHRHHSFLKMFLEFAVGTAVLALLPELAGAIAPILAPLLTTLVGSAAEGLVDAVISNAIAGEILGLASSLAQQETARGLGDQNHFSYHQFWQTGLENAEAAGLTAGLNAELPNLHFVNPFLKQAFQTSIPEAEIFSVSMQLMQLAFRQEKKFDWKALLVAALQAPVNKAIGEVASQMPTEGPIASTLAKTNFYVQAPSVFADDFISQEVYKHRFDAEEAAADSLGSYLGNTAALTAYSAYKNHLDQRSQTQWKNQAKQNNQMNSLDQINATTQALNDTTQKINAELAALGNINPFTGEPLDSGVTSGSALNDPAASGVGQTQRRAMDGSDNSNNISKNPSYANRQVEHTASENQARAQSNFQQQQSNFAAKGSSRNSFWNVGKTLAETVGGTMLGDLISLAKEANDLRQTNIPVDLVKTALYLSENPQALKDLSQEIKAAPQKALNSLENQITTFKSGDNITRAQIGGVW